MSQRGRAFFERWVRYNLGETNTAEGHVRHMLVDAARQGISRKEIAEEFGGNLVAAMKKAMWIADRT